MADIHNTSAITSFDQKANLHSSLLALNADTPVTQVKVGYFTLHSSLTPSQRMV